MIQAWRKAGPGGVAGPRTVKTSRTIRSITKTAVFLLLVLPAIGMGQDTAGKDVLRVCADPSNMPFSNAEKEGFENKIAELFGKELGLPVEYTWLAEQFGFARNTLKRWLAAENRYACDLIMSATAGFEMGKTTLPYYRSTYVLAYVKGRGLDAVKTPADLLALSEEERKNLVIGGFAGSPPIDWVVQNGMIRQLRGYRGESGNYTEDPGDMISKDLVNGDVDVALIWGPIGGYYAQQIKNVDIEVVPFTAADGMQMDFPISMAVRYGNDQWLERVQTFIDENRGSIMSILQDYNVPLVPLRPEDKVVVEEEDDDD